MTQIRVKNVIKGIENYFSGRVKSGAALAAVAAAVPTPLIGVSCPWGGRSN